MNAQTSTSQAIALAALRVSLGMLLVWWGLAKVVTPDMGVSVQKKYYFAIFPGESLQFAFGVVEVIIGLLVVVGFARKFAVAGQLLITGFSAMTIWSALLDPFALWLPVEKLSGAQHLFYPTVIALCGAAVMVVFRHEDRFNVDTLLENRKGGDTLETANAK